MLPTGVHISVNGSYVSAVLIALLSNSPIGNTFPFVTTDIVCSPRASFMLLIVVLVSVDGSYSSALLIAPLLNQPATNTFPFINTAAV
ncbi:unnamed protein product [Rotaria sp. Silwood2]|nr:unnamed protein product [Rotaria sp. Silwood2]